MGAITQGETAAQIERLESELAAAREREAAAAAILKVINRSRNDVQPVFETIARQAKELCGSLFGNVFRFDGEMVHAVASEQQVAQAVDVLRSMYPMRPDASQVSGRVILTKSIVRMEDALADPAYDPRFADAGGWRRMLGVPMLRDGEAIGAITVGWADPGPIPKAQEELLQTFADQAVIAIENARLFREIQERNADLNQALEFQTASGEILASISSSIADSQPVFDAIVKSTRQLFDTRYAVVSLIRDQRLELVAASGDETYLKHVRTAYPWPLSGNDGIAAERAFGQGQVVQICPIDGNPHAPERMQRLAKASGYNATILTPMMREGVAIGLLVTSRAQAIRFDGKQVALLKVFADQAVIAIENARLFNETREALERQTATAEILRVISGSPTNVQPVFDAIVEHAVRLCSATFGGVFRFDDGLLHFASGYNLSPAVLDAMRARFPMAPDASLVTGRAILSKSVACVEDAAADPAHDNRFAVAGGWRRMLGVPMLREGDPIGVIFLAWTEPGAVPRAQQELIKTFADQAVIAIENVRLFNETKEALEQQTAISEILGVISASPSDVAPVLDAVAERAMRICESGDARIFLVEGERLCHAAGRGELRAVEVGAALPLERGLVMGRAVIDRVPVHVEDLAGQSDPAYALGREVARQYGFRTTLAVPLLREQQALGAILLRRKEVRPFSEKQIALLKTFADQAAIAIENVRLFHETKEALERQTATAEILRAISESPTDAQPVFETIARNAVDLCESLYADVFSFDGEQLHLVANRNVAAEPAKVIGDLYPRRPDMATVSGRAILTNSPVHIEDVLADAQYHRNFAKARGVRRLLGVPMTRYGHAVGAIVVGWVEAGAVSKVHEDLLKTFADQAAIAIENVRLFKELAARTGQLSRSVQQLVALSKVGQAISSTLELETVLRTIVAHALELTGLDAGEIFEYDELAQRFHLRAAENLDAAVVEALRREPMRKGEGAIGRTAITGEPTEIADILDATYQSRVRELLVDSGTRALLAVPLLREQRLLGALVVNRKAPGSFARETVALLRTFATQSAVAIQNARLFREIESKSRQLEEASRHKSQFLARMSHELRTPLNAILGFNEMMLDEIYGEVPPDMREPLEETRKSGKHLLRLINNVLDLAKIEAGRMELALGDYAVQDVVQGVGSTLRPLAVEKGLELVASAPEDIPLARGDAGRLTQCLLNLAGNSLKFTRQGRVEISVALTDGRLVYRVADTGIGIPPEKMGGLFTEFKQTDAAIASEYGGTGLGLAISRKFVEMHGGRIWVESEPGRGSTFTFEVPLRCGAGASA